MTDLNQSDFADVHYDIWRRNFVYGSRADVASSEAVAKLGADVILCLDETLEDVEPVTLGVKQIACRYLSESLPADKLDFSYVLDDMQSIHQRKNRVMIQCRTGTKLAPGVLAAFLATREIDRGISVAIRTVENLYDVPVSDFMKSQLYNLYR